MVDLTAAYAAYLDRTDPGCDADRLAALLLPPDMTLFLGSGALGRGAAERAIETAAKTDDGRGARTRYRVPAGASDDEIRLLAPVARPRVLRDFLTFEGHMKQAFKALGRTDPVSPLFYQVPAYYKGDPDTVVGPDASVQVPQDREKFDFELELAMVVGCRGKNITKADAPRYIAGYTIWNDFSARDQQMKEGAARNGPEQGEGLRRRQRHRPVSGDGRRDRSGRSSDDRAGER